MIIDIKKEIVKILKFAGVAGVIELTTPPNPELGDISFPCFQIAKDHKQNPAATASELAEKCRMQNAECRMIDGVKAVGPYVNFFVNPKVLAEEFFGSLDDNYGQLKIGHKKKYLVEFGCPNPLKVFHLGHLKNLITGESVARILENAGYKVVRVNYQGDVGMHIAKALWALASHKSKVISLKSSPLSERVDFLGKVYAEGAQAFEKDETAKEDIFVLNKKVYAKDESIREMYELGRAWSLEYFDQIYQRLGTHFDELYFESEVWERGLEMVRAGLKTGIFKESQGAVIFPGSERGLHDRVFITSEGNPTYEAKDLALAERQFNQHHPDKIIHVVGKEQSEYFKVVFKALEFTLPESQDKESHLPGGFLQLKEGKMSSRTGQVVSADELLALAFKAVGEIMKDRELAHKDEVIEKVAMAAVKYAILKVGVSDDVAFDLKTSVSLEGDSGPYLLYIVARIKSILRKLEIRNSKLGVPVSSFQFPVSSLEKRILIQLASFPEITSQAAADLDPSKIAQYLFHLAQTFNTFYHECPVLEAEEVVRAFRVRLIQAAAQVMTHGLSLLGIETVTEM